MYQHLAFKRAGQIFVRRENMKTDNFLVYLSKTSITIKFSLPLILPIDWYFLDNKCFTIFFTPMVAKLNFWWRQFFKNFVEPNKFCQSDCSKASIESKTFFPSKCDYKKCKFSLFEPLLAIIAGSDQELIEVFWSSLLTKFYVFDWITGSSQVNLH